MGSRRGDSRCYGRRRVPSSETPPLRLLFEAPNLREFALPRGLVARYGGNIGFAAPSVIANFVASVDGVVELPGPAESGKVVSLASDDDRFVMGLLRACAGVVMVGAGTFRKTSKAFWYPESIYPAAKELFAELRRDLGLAPKPTFVIVSGSGSIEVTPSSAEALIVTTRAGETRLRPTLPATARIWVFDEPRVPLGAVMARLQAEGARVVLTEGGPSLFSELVAEKALDELFVTVSPVLFGRFPDDGRKALTHGLDLGRAPLELLSARASGSHLFLRYRLDRP